MKIATWNVNSVKVRHERLLRWLETKQPDVLCLQELKGVDDTFPRDEVMRLGYVPVTYGQKTYNGVATLVKRPLDFTDVVRGFKDGEPEDPQARLLSLRAGDVRVINGYMPNGSTVGSDKWKYKLAWLTRLRAYLARTAKPEDRLVVVGDYNIAPRDIDVHDPKEWADTVLCHPDARAQYEQMRAWGLTDIFEKHHPEGHIYTWWDYRSLGFPKNRGLRIDHILATKPQADRSVDATVDREERKGEQASDHAPVMAEFKD